MRRQTATDHAEAHQCEGWQFDPDWHDQFPEAHLDLERCRACGKVRVAFQVTDAADRHELGNPVGLVELTEDQPGVFVLHLHPWYGWVREYMDGQLAVLTARVPRPARVG